MPLAHFFLVRRSNWYSSRQGELFLKKNVPRMLLVKVAIFSWFSAWRHWTMQWKWLHFLIFTPKSWKFPTLNCSIEKKLEKNKFEKFILEFPLVVNMTYATSKLKFPIYQLNMKLQPHNMKGQSFLLYFPSKLAI